MKKVTVNFTNSMKKEETASFNIYSKAEKAQYLEDAKGISSFNRDLITPEDWEDAIVEARAALAAGIQLGAPFYYIQTA